MEIPVYGLQKTKFIIHCVQVLVLVVVWCLTVGVLVSAGTGSSPSKWYFAVAWLTAPALIYQTMSGRWFRTRQYANPWAFAIVDGLFCMLWFSGWIAVAVWNSSGIKRGASKATPPIDNGSCATFDFGSERRCKMSEASVGLGVLLTALFTATSAISVYGVYYYRQNGHLPGDTSNFPDPMMMPMHKPSDAFSASMDDDDVESISRPNGSRPLPASGSEAYRPLGDDPETANGHANGWRPQGHTPYSGQYENAIYNANQHQQQDDYFSPVAVQQVPPAADAAGPSNPQGTVPFPRADYERA